MSAHTPGPWEYVAAPSLKPEFRFGMFGDFAVYAPGNAHPWRMAEVVGPDAHTAEANAHLIAAAPDLLAACEAALPLVDAWESTDGDKAHELAEMLRAAIAKARPA